MKKHLFLSIIVAIASAIFFQIKDVAAQQPTPSDDEVNRIARELYCPVCENTPLDVCPTKACAQWRELIRQKLQEGWSGEQIKEYFARQYGDQVLAEPAITGFNRWVYIVPLLIIFFAGAILFSTLRKSRMTVRNVNGHDPSSGKKGMIEMDDQKVEEELLHYNKR